MINLIVFIILNGMMATFLFRYSARLKNPLNSAKYLTLEGTEMFLVILFATGTLSLASVSGGHNAGSGINLQAIRLLLLEVFLVFSLFVSSSRPRLGIGTIAYIIYIVWLFYTLTYAPSISYGFRYILKYLYPLIMMIAASAIVRDEEVFVAICVWMRRVAIVAMIVGSIPFLSRLLPTNFFWYLTALTMHYVTVICTSLALYFFYGKDKKDLLLAAIFVIPTVLTVHRSGILATFAGLAAFAFYKYKWVSLPYIFGVLAIGLAIIFYVPRVHQKMFWKDTENELTIQDLRAGNIEEDDIRNNGRKAIWGVLKEEFYEGHELKGSGIGSCQMFLYEHINLVKQTHGDYVQMQCDTGLIGMWLYIAVAISICIHCFVVCVTPYVPDYIKCCAMIAASSIVGNYAGMYSENVVTYTMATSGYAFGFYGIMLGLLTKVEKPKESIRLNSL